MTTYEPKGRSIWQVLREGDELFAGEGAVNAAVRRLAQQLDEENIPYALIGGMALIMHGYKRFTDEVNILLSTEGLTLFQEKCVGRGYVPAVADAQTTFRDTIGNVKIEIITTGEYPGDGKPKPVAFPDPAQVSTRAVKHAVCTVERDGIRIIQLEKLIELKLASGLSAPHRLRDLADVQDLIMNLNLPIDLADRLDASVRDEYRRLWEAGQAEND